MAGLADSDRLFEQVRRIEIRGRNAALDTLAGRYRSVFKGTGLDFQEVRPYQPGDERKRIDWNVTARRGELHVKTFHEERTQQVLLVVDGSGSTDFGSGGETKRDTIAELCGLVTFSALLNRDRVGLALFDERVERYIPPRRGREHGLRLVREILTFAPASPKTSLAEALQTVLRVVNKRSIIFVLSDFLDSGYEEHLQRAAIRHDCIAIEVRDPVEHELPAGGLTRLVDLETGERVKVDLASARFREDFSRSVKEASEARRDAFAALGVDTLTMRAGADCVAPLRAFLDARLQRRAGR